MTVRVRADTTRYYSATAFEQRLSTNLGQDCSCYVVCSEQSVVTIEPQPVPDSDLIIRTNSEYTKGQGLITAGELSKRLRDGMCRSYRIDPFLRVYEVTENALGTCKNAFSLVDCRRTEASHNTGDMHGRPSTLPPVHSAKSTAGGQSSPVPRLHTDIYAQGRIPASKIIHRECNTCICRRPRWKTAQPDPGIYA